MDYQKEVERSLQECIHLMEKWIEKNKEHTKLEIAENLAGYLLELKPMYWDHKKVLMLAKAILEQP